MEVQDELEKVVQLLVHMIAFFYTRVGPGQGAGVCAGPGSGLLEGETSHDDP
jgi:hypothetical protein